MEDKYVAIIFGDIAFRCGHSKKEIRLRTEATMGKSMKIKKARKVLEVKLVC